MHIKPKQILSTTPETPNNSVPEAELKDKVAGAITRLLNDQPFWGTLVLKMQTRMDNTIPVAAVDVNRNLLLNPEWLAGVSTPDLCCVLLHETLHPALGVFERQGNRKAIVVTASGQPVSLWNIAHDYAINMIISELSEKNAWISCPSKSSPPGLLDMKFKDLSAEEIYDILLEEAMQNGEGEGEGEGDGLDDGEAQDGKGKGKVKPSKGKGKGKGEPQSGKGRQFEDHHADVDGEGSPSPSQMKESEEYWKQTILQANMAHEMGGRQRGDLPGSIQKIINDLLEPKIHWRDVLARWIGENGRKSDYTYSRPSRRSEGAGVILPSLRKHGVDDVCVLWDTSGSMDGREREILSEIIGMCKDMAMSVRVICCDMGIHSDHLNVEEADQIEIKGGGGSDFCPAFARLQEEGYDKIVVAFTDGIIGVPEVPPPALKGTLWVIWERDGDVDPTGGKWGEVIRVKDNIAKQ